MKPHVRSVSVKIRQTTSRVPFRGGTFTAHLEDESSGNFAIVGTTRGHDTWAAAAVAALHFADQRDFIVLHRGLIEQRIRKEGGTP
jgi:hypothetical protein